MSTTAVDEDFSSQLFITEIRGESLKADPIVVRTKLLAATQGRAWALVMHHNNLNDAIRNARTSLKILRDDLQLNPPTPLELNPPPPRAPITVIEGQEPPPPPPPPPANRLQQCAELEAQISIAIQQQSQNAVYLAQATASAFDLEMFDSETGVGMTCMEMLKLLGTFMEYAEKKESQSNI